MRRALFLSLLLSCPLSAAARSGAEDIPNVVLTRTASVTIEYGGPTRRPLLQFYTHFLHLPGRPA